MENQKRSLVFRKLIGAILIFPFLLVIVLITIMYILTLASNGSGEWALGTTYPILISLPLFFIGLWVLKWKKLFWILLILSILLYVFFVTRGLIRINAIRNTYIAPPSINNL